jgi:glycosyltransferase involved in cell wall biosynthesis
LEAARALGVKTWLVPNLTRYIIPWKDLRVISDVKRIVGEFQPDIIHANSSKAGFAARLAARRVGRPVIFTARGWAFAANTPLWRRPLVLAAERLLAPLATRIVCVSHDDRELAIRCKVGKPEQLLVIHNGATDIPLQTTYPERRPVRGVMVARFSRQKDHALLLGAFAELKLPMELLLVGEGELLEKNRRLAQSLGIADRVRFLGGRTDVAEILADCDIFVLTSHYEGFPNVVLEAMRAGLPVIASDVGGTREAILQEITGFVIPHGNRGALKEKLTYLVQNRDARIKMGQAGRQHYLDNFTADKMTDAYFRIYHAISTTAKT